MKRIADSAIAMGCASSSSASPTSPSSAAGGTPTTTSGCAVTPEETAGPYPGNVGMINNSAYFRRNVTEGKPGLPLTLALTIVSVGSGFGTVANADVEIWHCDAAGDYSEYSQQGLRSRVTSIPYVASAFRRTSVRASRRYGKPPI